MECASRLVGLSRELRVRTEQVWRRVGAARGRGRKSGGARVRWAVVLVEEVREGERLTARQKVADGADEFGHDAWCTC